MGAVDCSQFYYALLRDYWVNQEDIGAALVTAYNGPAQLRKRTAPCRITRYAKLRRANGVNGSSLSLLKLFGVYRATVDVPSEQYALWRRVDAF